MSQADQALVDTLLTTLGNAYAPYSNHPVAASVRHSAALRCTRRAARRPIDHAGRYFCAL